MKKIFYFLCAAILFGTIAPAAKADQVNFKFQVLDPSIDHVYLILPPLETIPVTFSDHCLGLSLPSDTYCFNAINLTGETITSLDLVFDDTSGLDGETPDCSSSNYPGDTAEFTSESCSYDPSDGLYTLDFYGGTGIQTFGIFTIVETGLDPSAFPDALTAVPNTPEPASVWMLSTAAAMLGLLLFMRRKGFGNELG